MTDVKSKRLAGGETFETADRLHSAAIHLLRRLRVRDRESGVGPAQLSALSVLVLGGGPRSLGLYAAEKRKTGDACGSKLLRREPGSSRKDAGGAWTRWRKPSLLFLAETGRSCVN